jgi:tRNA A-37 threonylcarbamoyl transferase component Bud32
VKDSYPDPDPAEESESVRWHFDDHMESPTPIEPSPQFKGDYAVFDLDMPAELPWPEEVRRANVHPKNRFSRYVLVDQLGCGPSGTVFRAWDTRWNQYAALKILHTLENGALERFIREAPRAASLKHPGIASTYEAGAHLGHLYVAMTFIEGRPVDAERRSVSLTLELMRDVCRAIEHAHDRGVVHGGLKPSNILVDRLDRPFVTDFGAPNHRLMSDPRDDVHDLGATLKALLAGAPTSPELEAIIARATSVSRTRRFATAGELGNELDRLLLTRRYAGSYGLPLRLARKWGPVAVAGVLLALLFAWVVPSFLATATAGVDVKPDPYRKAAIALLHLGESNDLAARMGGYRSEHLAALAPSLESRVLGIRVSIAEGDLATASKEVEALSKFQDYRIGYFRALIELESALKAPLPLPAPESPAPEWVGTAPDFQRFHDALTGVLGAPVEEDSLLHAEHRRDAEAARALLALAEGHWAEASEKLTELTQTQRLPVYLAARRAASYLARRFDEVLDEPGTQLALAMESSLAPAEDVKRLRSLFVGREATLYCWAARRLVAQGSSPSSVVKEALALKLDNESQAILRIADLRGNRSAAAPLYKVCRDLLGDKPSTWMGRLASIEAHLGIGRGLALSGGDSQPSYERALKEAEAVGETARLLRAEALLGLGRAREARHEALRIKGSGETRALILASAASLNMSEVQDAAAFADRALARVKDHPDALTLRAASKIQCASCKCALRDLDAVLDRAPDFVEARFYRAAAHFLSANADAASDVHLANAIADLDRLPDLEAAQTLRSLVRASVGRPSSCDHLKETLKRAAAEDSTGLLTWLHTAWTPD